MKWVAIKWGNFKKHCYTLLSHVIFKSTIWWAWVSWRIFYIHCTTPKICCIIWEIAMRWIGVKWGNFKKNCPTILSNVIFKETIRWVWVNWISLNTHCSTILSIVIFKEAIGWIWVIRKIF
jgi:hypothetical protein